MSSNFTSPTFSDALGVVQKTAFTRIKAGATAGNTCAYFLSSDCAVGQVSACVRTGRFFVTGDFTRVLGVGARKERAVVAPVERKLAAGFVHARNANTGGPKGIKVAKGSRCLVSPVPIVGLGHSGAFIVLAPATPNGFSGFGRWSVEPLLVTAFSSICLSRPARQVVVAMPVIEPIAVVVIKDVAAAYSFMGVVLQGVVVGLIAIPSLG